MPARSRGLGAIEALLAAYHGPATPELPRFWGGLVGVWGHDAVRAFERLSSGPAASAGSGEPPAIDLIVSDTVLVFDNFSQTVQIFAGACPASDGGSEAAIAAAHARIDAVAALLDSGSVLRPQRLPEVAAPRRHAVGQSKARRRLDLDRELLAVPHADDPRPTAEADHAVTGPALTAGADRLEHVTDARERRVALASGRGESGIDLDRREAVAQQRP